MIHLEEIDHFFAGSKAHWGTQGRDNKEKTTPNKPRGLATQSEVRFVPFSFSSFHSIDQGYFRFNLALSTSIVRWVYTHNKIGDHTGEFNPIWSLMERETSHESSSFIFQDFWHLSKQIDLVVNFNTFLYTWALSGVPKVQKFNW